MGTAVAWTTVTGPYTSYPSRRSERADRLLAAGDLVGCVAELDYLRQEFGYSPDLKVYEAVFPLIGREHELEEIVRASKLHDLGLALISRGWFVQQESIRLIHLARALCEIGQYEKALQVLPPKSPNQNFIVDFLEVRGRARLGVGQYEKALRDFDEVATTYGIAQRVSATAVDDVALHRIDCLLALDRLDEAESAVEQVGRKLEGVYPEGHPRSVRCLVCRARLLGRRGRREDVIATLERTLQAEREFFLRGVFGLPEQSLIALARRIEEHTNWYVGEVLSFHRDSPARVKKAFELVSNHKSLVLDCVALLHQRIGRSDDRLRDIRAQLARLLLLPLFGESNEAAQGRITELEGERQRLEREIGRTGTCAEATLPEPISSERIRDLLGPGTAVIEYAVARPLDRRVGGLRSDDRYVALVLPPGRHQPRLVDLGPSTALERAVRRVRQRIVENHEARRLAAPSSRAAADFDDESFREGCAELYSACVEPIGSVIPCPHNRLDFPEDELKAHLTPLHTLDWLVCPVGELNLVGFAALLDRRGEFLAENVCLRLALSASHAVRNQEPTSPARETILVGSPQFGRPVSGSGLGERDPEPGVSFAPLPKTAIEVDTIGRLLEDKGRRVIVWKDHEASRQNLLAVESPLWLHIATHGFFLPKVELSTGSYSLLVESPDIDFFAQTAVESLSSRSPYTRCGLALANANTRDHEGTVGIVTAEDILSLSLRGTELVALSACDTGRGVLSTQSDVHGLVRAFQIAGARHVIASMWRVGDDDAAVLMPRFYRHLLGGRSPALALHAAIIEVIGLGRGVSPAQWGAFQMYLG